MHTAMNMHAYCYEHAWILPWTCLYTAMNMPVYCHEHAWRLCFQFFCKGKVCKTFPGVGSIAGSYYNFIFNIVGNNSVLHSNYTILHSFQLSTNTNSSRSLSTRVIFLFVCSCVCLPSVQGGILLWFGWAAVNVGFHFSMWVCLSGTLNSPLLWSTFFSWRSRPLEATPPESYSTLRKYL